MIFSIPKTMLRLIIFYILISLQCFFLVENSFAGSVDQKLHKRLSNISKLLTKNNHSKAIARLEPLLKYTKNKTYEGALVNQLAGYAYLAAGKNDTAIKHFTKSIQNDSLPSKITQEIKLILIQLYFSASRNKKAKELFEKWESDASTIKASDYALGGYIYVSLKNYEKAEEYLKNAIGHLESANESWLKLLLYVYYETHQYSKAMEMLEQLVTNNPENADYWRRLSGIKYELKDINGSLSILQIAYRKDLLDQKNDILRLANLYMLNSLPLQAASLIDDNLKTGKIKPSKTITEMLFNAYAAAQDIHTASHHLESQGDAESHSVLFLHGAYLYMENEDWARAELLLQQLVAIKNPPSSSFLALGITYTNQNNYDKARKWLKKAERDESTRNSATGWMKFIKNREK